MVVVAGASLVVVVGAADSVVVVGADSVVVDVDEVDVGSSSTGAATVDPSDEQPRATKDIITVASTERIPPGSHLDGTTSGQAGDSPLDGSSGAQKATLPSLIRVRSPSSGWT